MVKEHTVSLLERTRSFGVGIYDGLHRVIPNVLNRREENIHTFLLIIGVVLPKDHVVINLGPTCGKGIDKNLQSFVPSLVDYGVDGFLNTGTSSSGIWQQPAYYLGLHFIRLLPFVETIGKITGSDKL